MKWLAILLAVGMVMCASEVRACGECAELPLDPDQLGSWEMYSEETTQRGDVVHVVRNPGTRDGPPVVMYLISRVKVLSQGGLSLFVPCGPYISRFCFLDKGVVRDFAYCDKCQCWHEVDMSQYPQHILDFMKDKLLSPLGDPI